MARFELKVTGGDAILRKFAQAPQLMAEKSAKIIWETALEIENKAKARVPVDTTALRSSIRATKLSDGSAMIKAGLPNVTNSKGHLVNYAGYVEFGTGNGYRKTNYKNLDNSSIDVYAGEFKASSAKQVNRTPNPYMFNSADELIGKLVNRIKKIKI